MILFAWALALTLWLIAAIHVYWGLGGLWPATDPVALARTVVGARGIMRMPSTSACLAVALALTLIGCWPLVATGVLPLPGVGGLLFTAGHVIALVFLLRGVAAYLVGWRRRVPEQPFATLDRWFYGPLCIAIWLGFQTILAKGMI